jgi:methyl-accepting chemotaxis protein
LLHKLCREFKTLKWRQSRFLERNLYWTKLSSDAWRLVTASLLLGLVGEQQAQSIEELRGVSHQQARNIERLTENAERQARAIEVMMSAVTQLSRTITSMNQDRNALLESAQRSAQASDAAQMLAQSNQVAIRDLI